MPAQRDQDAIMSSTQPCACVDG